MAGKTFKKLKTLWQRIPGFECVPGCRACCGPVFWSKVEWKRIKNKKGLFSPVKIKGVTFFLVQDQQGNCPYASEKGCEVYNDRPLLCRLYGVVEKMLCPFGGKPERILSIKEERQINNEYLTILRG